MEFKTLAPIIVSIVSLAFGIYQYFDKRTIERQNKELEGREKELLLKEKEFNTKADLIVFYVETSIWSILSYSTGYKSDQEPMNSETFDEAILSWVNALEEQLPFKVKLNLIGNSQYDELKRYCHSPDSDASSDHIIKAMLIRNEGKYPASNIVIKFVDAQIGENAIPMEQCFPIKDVTIDILNEKEAALMFVVHYNKKTSKRIGTELAPNEKLSYFDKLLQKEIELKVRIPYEVPQIVDSGLLIRG